MAGVSWRRAHNYQCLNQDCGKQLKDKYTWSDDETPVLCECGSTMFQIPKDVNVATPYLRFNSMSNDQKKEMLTKRSHDHFNREIKERKHELLKASGLDGVKNNKTR